MASRNTPGSPVLDFLRNELASTPQRQRATLRIVLASLIGTTLIAGFHIPEGHWLIITIFVGEPARCGDVAGQGPQSDGRDPRRRCRGHPGRDRGERSAVAPLPRDRDRHRPRPVRGAHLYRALRGERRHHHLRPGRPRPSREPGGRRGGGALAHLRDRPQRGDRHRGAAPGLARRSRGVPPGRPRPATGRRRGRARPPPGRAAASGRERPGAHRRHPGRERAVRSARPAGERRGPAPRPPPPARGADRAHHRGGAPRHRIALARTPCRGAGRPVPAPGRGARPRGRAARRLRVRPPGAPRATSG